jgi:hypothetical protein
MNSGLYSIETRGLAKVGGIFSGRPAKSPLDYLGSALVWAPAALITVLGGWMLLSGDASNTAESEPVRLATAVAAQPLPPPASNAARDGPSVAPASAAPLEAITPAESAPVDGLRISSQSWRRGGLGSNALITFTLRNRNDYAVKDIEIACAFARSDGSHLTDRTRMIHDTVSMKSRKTFAHLHVGFVNINAQKAKCSLVTASHI